MVPVDQATVVVATVGGAHNAIVEYFDRTHFDQINMSRTSASPTDSHPTHLLSLSCRLYVFYAV